MANKLHRRTLLKTAALFTGALGAGPALLSAAPRHRKDEKVLPPYFSEDEQVLETTPVELKARLLANENPFGPSPKAKEAIMAALNKSYQYPGEARKSMMEKIAAFEGITPEHIIMGAGSTPLLLAGALAYGKKTVVSAGPTYEDLLRKSESIGGKVMRIPLTDKYQYNLPALEAAIDETVSLVYICNPNNPTATIVDTAALKGFCERVSKKTMVFVDEAYIDLVDNPAATTVIGMVKEGHNIIVARTFSKLYGMAGLRCGYAVAQPAVIRNLSKYTCGPNSISATTLAGALASYQDHDFMKFAYDHIMESKQFLYETLRKQGYEYIPSSTNFAMFPLRMEGPAFVKQMMDKGVGVRSWRFSGKDWCRVSIGTMDEMKLFAGALATIG